MVSRTLTIGIFFASMLAACSKSEPPAPKPQASAPITPATTADSTASPAQIDPALKDRLARQEAAAQMFERKVLAPEPPKPATPTAAAAPKASASPAPEPAKVAPAPTPEPPKVAAAAPVKAAPEKAAAPAPAKAEPAPRTDVAAAKPSSAPAAVRLVNRVDPDFPREAVQAGVEKGTVKARMTLDEKGAVSRVEVLDATPRRVFDRAVIRALSQWTFNEGTAGRTVEMEVDFKR